MASPVRTWLVVAALLAAAPRALASGEAPEAPEEQLDRGWVEARKAVDAKEWDRAVKLLTEVADRQGSNPDVFNLLGYAERKRGNLDAAFARYERALQLDPRHRGAHEYKGEAHLQAGDLAGAEAHLAALERICGSSCHEYQDLAKAIAEHRRRAGASR